MVYGHSTKDFNALQVFTLIFVETMHLLVAETTILSPVLDRLQLTRNALPMPHVTTQEKSMSLYITVQMGHHQRDTVTDYRPTPELLLWPFV